MGQLESIVEHFQIFLQSQGGCWQLLLIGFNMLRQLSRGVNELEPFTALESGQQPLVILGVLPYPGVAVVDIDGSHVLICKARKHNKPLGQKVRLKPVAWANMRQINHYFVGLCVVGLKSEEHMVDEQVPIDLACFESIEMDKRQRKTLSTQGNFCEHSVVKENCR